MCNLKTSVNENYLLHLKTKKVCFKQIFTILSVFPSINVNMTKPQACLSKCANRNVKWLTRSLSQRKKRKQMGKGKRKCMHMNDTKDLSR